MFKITRYVVLGVSTMMFTACGGSGDATGAKPLIVGTGPQKEDLTSNKPTKGTGAGPKKKDISSNKPTKGIGAGPQKEDITSNEPAKEADGATITHNGVTYAKVISPFTGKEWLDRNLGASQVCAEYNDIACYGDYYQWGRSFDGHEKSKSTTSDIQVMDVNKVGSAYIIPSDKNSTGLFDWASTSDTKGNVRQQNWAKIDGSSVCPKGFRVPTIEELEAELLATGADIKNSNDAFDSFLKLPSAGFRKLTLPSAVLDLGAQGMVWSNSVHDNVSIDITFNKKTARKGFDSRADGRSVRCVKN